MSYRALERIAYQDADGATNVIQPGGDVPPGVAFHAPEAVEDTDEDVELGAGTSAAEQKGLDPEGASTIEQGKLNEQLRDGDQVVREGVFASSYLPGQKGEFTSSGEPVGSEGDLNDQQAFRQAQAEADEAAAKRQEERTATMLRDTEQAQAEQVSLAAPAAAETAERRQARAQAAGGETEAKVAKR